MSEPFLGEIKMVGFNFEPNGYLYCNGQILAIALNTALFSLLGTYYGGNGQTTFALPDFRGRVPTHWGQGPGLSSYTIGQVAGNETTTLITNNLPNHAHSFAPPVVTGMANTSTADSSTVLAVPDGGEQIYSTAAPNGTLKAGNTGGAGSNQPFSNMQPYTTITFVIAVEGIYPSRN